VEIEILPFYHLLRLWYFLLWQLRILGQNQLKPELLEEFLVQKQLLQKAQKDSGPLPSP
jgi:hypothetical protein